MNSTDRWDILSIFRIQTRLFYSRSLSSAMPASEQGHPDIMVTVEVPVDVEVALLEETTKLCSRRRRRRRREKRRRTTTTTRRTEDEDEDEELGGGTRRK